jgi:beta-glucosidase/6-phospho-beta-glucosidase/beta-galactosidase
MQNAVKERLPNFTREQSEMIKGSADYIAINHYTTYYVSHHVKQDIHQLSQWLGCENFMYDTFKSHSIRPEIFVPFQFFAFLANTFWSSIQMSVTVCQLGNR